MFLHRLQCKLRPFPSAMKSNNGLLFDKRMRNINCIEMSRVHFSLLTAVEQLLVKLNANDL